MEDIICRDRTSGIIRRLEALKSEYADNNTVRENGTLLLGPGTIPRSRHMLFVGLEDELINDYLVAEYKLPFPEAYKDFLRYSNGANLFTVKINFISSGNSFASNLFTIYGLPRTDPFSRPDCMEEPYDLRVEDLGRHKKLPKTWLKCGAYYKDCNLDVRTDIFIDTESCKVYSCNKNECEIIDSWDNLDECLCAIFDSFKDCRNEYDK